MRWVAALERLGNRLPDPIVLFAIFGAILLGVSKLTAGVSVSHPATGELVVVQDLLAGAGLRRVFTDAVKSFAAFPPLGTVLVAMLGIGVAERSGLFGALLSRLVGVPPGWLTAALIFAGVNASLAADAGFVVLVPLGAALYAACGRNPIAGVTVAVAGVSGGFSANLLITSLDPLLSGITESAARLLDPAATVSPACNWYFMAASVFWLTAMGTLVARRWVEPRLPPGGAGEAPAPTDDRAALRATAIAVALFLLALAALAFGPLRAEDGSFKPFFESIVLLVALGFFVVGATYGRARGTLPDNNSVARAMGEAMSSMGSYIALAFVAAQVVAWFGWSNLGLVLAVGGASGLKTAGFGGTPLLLSVVALSASINLLMASASAKWAILAPVLVPMLMLLGIPPEVTQLAYRVGDSTTNIITPLMPYFPIVLTVCRKYEPTLGLGTLLTVLLPYSVVFFVGWTILLVAWVEMGWALGV